jgi:hypothetical protein
MAPHPTYFHSTPILHRRHKRHCSVLGLTSKLFNLHLRHCAIKYFNDGNQRIDQGH